jgi:hypothetical protein
MLMELMVDLAGNDFVLIERQEDFELFPPEQLVSAHLFQPHVDSRLVVVH